MVDKAIFREARKDMAVRYHIFQIEESYCVVDVMTADVFVVTADVAEKLYKLMEEENNIEEMDINSIEDNEKESARRCHRLTLNITSKCNLACRYCYANCGDYKQSNSEQFEMTLMTVENAVRKTIVLYPEGIQMIQIFGGEPLMAKRHLKDIIEVIKTVCIEEGVEIPMFGMVSNGTLIDEETAEFLVNNLCSITISLDGKETVNDFNRRFPGENGYGVYRRVKDAVKLLKKYDKNFRVKCECTVTAANIRDYLENGKKDNLFYAIYEDIGFDSCLCNPVFGSDDEEISLETLDFDVIAEYFDDFLCQQIHDEEGKLKEVTDLYRISKILLKKQSLKRQCGANKSDLAVDIKGDMYPCFMFIGADEYTLGNVNEATDIEMKEKYERVLSSLENANDNSECKKCWAQRFCSAGCGNCIGARYLANGSVKKPIKQNCEIGKKQLERFIWEAVRYQKEK